MTYYENLQQQAAIRDMANGIEWRNPFAATLTFKKSLLVDGDRYKCIQRLTRDRAEKNVKHFTNLMNRKIYKNEFTRKNKRLTLFGMFEGSDTKHLHYHCQIDCPEEIPNWQFPLFIADQWYETHWSNFQIEIEKCYDYQGWLDYITKTADKDSVTEGLDVLNVNY